MDEPVALAQHLPPLRHHSLPVDQSRQLFGAAAQNHTVVEPLAVLHVGLDVPKAALARTGPLLLELLPGGSSPDAIAARSLQEHAGVEVPVASGGPVDLEIDQPHLLVDELLPLAEESRPVEAYLKGRKLVAVAEDAGEQGLPLGGVDLHVDQAHLLFFVFGLVELRHALFERLPFHVADDEGFVGSAAEDSAPQAPAAFSPGLDVRRVHALAGQLLNLLVESWPLQSEHHGVPLRLALLAEQRQELTARRGLGRFAAGGSRGNRRGREGRLHAVDEETEDHRGLFRVVQLELVVASSGERERAGGRFVPRYSEPAVVLVERAAHGRRKGGDLDLLVDLERFRVGRNGARDQHHRLASGLAGQPEFAIAHLLAIRDVHLGNGNAALSVDRYRAAQEHGAGDRGQRQGGSQRGSSSHRVASLDSAPSYSELPLRRLNLPGSSTLPQSGVFRERAIDRLLQGRRSGDPVARVMTRLAAFLASYVLIFALLTATAWVAGRLAIRRWIETEGLERFAISTALGLALLAHFTFALGALGQLRRGPLILLLAAVHLLGLPVWRDALRECRSWRRKAPLRFLLAGFGLVIAAAPLFVLALYPPTGFDETLYHLPFARAFARSGSLPFLPELRLPVFPQLNELLFAGMLLLADDVATHLVQLLATLLTAALLLAWGRRSFSQAAGWLAAATFLGNPIVVHLAGTGYIEPGLFLFITAAVFALERWRESRGSGWLVLAAVFSGSAAGIKYLGLFFVAAVLIAALPEAIRRRRIREVILASVVSLAVLAPTYGRILFYTGSPLFPFYPKIFGSNLWDMEPVPDRSLAQRLTAYASIPWDVLFERDSVGNQPPYSPAYLLGLPLLLWGFLRNGLVRRLLAMAFAYSLLFPFLPPDARYLAVVLPLLSLALGGSLAVWNLRRWAMPAIAVFLFLPGWLYGLHRIEREGPLPVTAAARDLYLAREVPGYSALQYLNRVRGARYVAYGVHAENLVYYAEGKLLGDWNGPASFRRVLIAMESPEAFHRRLRELGVGYLLRFRTDRTSLPHGPLWRRRFRRIYADGAAEIYELSPFSTLPGT